MAALLTTSFGHNLLFFFTRGEDYGEKIVPLIFYTKKSFLSKDFEILNRSSQYTYQQRKKQQVASTNSKDANIS
jgi:hypothetical protein